MSDFTKIKTEKLGMKAIGEKQELTSKTDDVQKNFLKYKRFFSFLFISLLLSVQSLEASIFLEENGLLVMEIESAPLAGKWESRTDISGYSGTAYYHATADNFGGGGEGPASDPVSRRFNPRTDILIAQFDNKPDADDIQAQAAFASILAHPDGKKINYYAVTGAYGTQKGKYINSNSLFAMAFGKQNKKWTDAHTDRENSVKRIVDKVMPVLKSGGWVWVQEAGQSDITAAWIAALLKAGVPEATIKNNVIIVQHSKWNENATTKADLNYVKAKANYIDIDDGNVDFGVYSSDRPKRQAQTPGYVSKDIRFMIEAMSVNNPNKKVRDIWIEADRIIKESGFNPNWSEIPKGGVDFSDCVEIWYILELGENANSVRKFWDRYVINKP